MKYLTGYLATIVGFSIGATHAASVAPTPFSKYGQIQNVQNYSSNPFWNKDSPYNQNFPRPIYATGPDLNTGDCNRTVETLISTYCASKNYCAGMRIGDIRPHIMVQLSQLPGHNFATSCGGYIDSSFDKYMNNRGNTSAVIPPMPTTQPTTSVTIQNPFKQTKSEYQQAVADRTAELNRLQKMTGTPATITPTAFPKTTADISFTDRMANTAAGYLPYKDLPSYRVPNFEEESSQAYLDRLKQLNRDKYCERVPNDTECVAKNTHKITYVTYGGSPTTGAPTTYTTGTGATITWQPTRDPNQPNPPVDPDPTAQTNIACLNNLANDSNFKSKIASDLNGVTDLNTWINNHKTGFYSFVADYVIQYCLKGSSSDITEFNTLLDSSNTIPITIDFNGGTTAIPIDKTELFDYATYWTYPIVIANNGVKNIGATLTKSVVSLPNYSRQCTGPLFKLRSLGPLFSGAKTAIEAGARPVYPKPRGDGFAIGNISFPGMLYNYHQTKSEYLPVTTKNYALARKQIKDFVAGVIADGECNGNNVMVYLVSEPSPDANKPNSVRIISEPFFIR